MLYTRRISLAVTALLAVLIAVPSQASAASQVPFRATFAETFTASPCSPVPSLCVVAVGSGVATHLGRTLESNTVLVNLASNAEPGCNSETRETILTAANGDQIVLHAPGQSCATGPTTVAALDFYVVTGGSGRFSGASGSGTVNVAVDQASGTAVSTFTGTLSTPGSLR